MKEHKKMYKAGKNWMVATLFGVSVLTAAAATNTFHPSTYVKANDNNISMLRGTNDNNSIDIPINDIPNYYDDNDFIVRNGQAYYKDDGREIPITSISFHKEHSYTVDNNSSSLPSLLTSLNIYRNRFPNFKVIVEPFSGSYSTSIGSYYITNNVDGARYYDIVHRYLGSTFGVTNTSTPLSHSGSSANYGEYVVRNVDASSYASASTDPSASATIPYSSNAQSSYQAEASKARSMAFSAYGQLSSANTGLNEALNRVPVEDANRSSAAQYAIDASKNMRLLSATGKENAALSSVSSLASMTYANKDLNSEASYASAAMSYASSMSSLVAKINSDTAAINSLANHSQSTAAMSSAYSGSYQAEASKAKSTAFSAYGQLSSANTGLNEALNWVPVEDANRSSAAQYAIDAAKSMRLLSAAGKENAALSSVSNLASMTYANKDLSAEASYASAAKSYASSMSSLVAKINSDTAAINSLANHSQSAAAMSSTSNSSQATSSKSANSYQALASKAKSMAFSAYGHLSAASTGIDNNMNKLSPSDANYSSATQYASNASNLINFLNNASNEYSELSHVSSLASMTYINSDFSSEASYANEANEYAMSMVAVAEMINSDSAAINSLANHSQSIAAMSSADSGSYQAEASEAKSMAFSAYDQLSSANTGINDALNQIPVEDNNRSSAAQYAIDAAKSMRLLSTAGKENAALSSVSSLASMTYTNKDLSSEASYASAAKSYALSMSSLVARINSDIAAINSLANHSQFSSASSVATSSSASQSSSQSVIQSTSSKAD